jgi:hypothetical protein
MAPAMSSEATSPMNFMPSQLKFNLGEGLGQRAPWHSRSKGNNNSKEEGGTTRDNNDNNTDQNRGYRHNIAMDNDSIKKMPRTLPFLGHIRLVRNPEVDKDGQTEVAAIYSLLVISSLSIVDNAIGLMVATRRSLRLTQVAFAIWCLRFLFRILSLISVLFMLTLSVEIQKRLPLNVELGGDSLTGSGGGVRSEEIVGGESMITVTILELIVALVHGWSLLVLIRDLRNQPRPGTVLSQVWKWFCGTRWGARWRSTSTYSYQGISNSNSNHNDSVHPSVPTPSSPYLQSVRDGSSLPYANLSSSSLPSLGLFGRDEESIDDLESVWSLRASHANAETMSIRSVRSVRSVRSIRSISSLGSFIFGRASSPFGAPEMVCTTPPGRSRASSVCSSEKM